MDFLKANPYIAIVAALETLLVLDPRFVKESCRFWAGVFDLNDSYKKREKC
jgi:hypothetical protein